MKHKSNTQSDEFFCQLDIRIEKPKKQQIKHPEKITDTKNIVSVSDRKSVMNQFKTQSSEAIQKLKRAVGLSNDTNSKNNVDYEENFKSGCEQLYKAMQDYQQAIKEVGKKSKFINWFAKITYIKSDSDKENCLFFLESLAKNGVPSKRSVWNNDKLNEIQSVLRSIKEGKLNIEFKITYDDFDSDKRGWKTKHVYGSGGNWKSIKSSEIYKNIDNITNLKEFMNAIKNVKNFSQDKKLDLNNTEKEVLTVFYAYHGKFYPIAQKALVGLSSFMRDEILQKKKKGKKMKGISLNDPTKFTKSKKFKIISLLIKFILSCYKRFAKYQDVILHDAGRHGIFVEVQMPPDDEHKEPYSIHLKFFDLNEEDGYTKSYDFRTPIKEVSGDDFIKPEKSLNEVKNMGMYKKVYISSDGKSAIAEVEYYKSKGIDSALELLFVAYDVCTFFQYLHGKKLVHCDIKEANIIVTEKGTKVIDIDGIQEEGYSKRPQATVKNKKRNKLRYVTKFIDPVHFNKVWIDQTDDLNSFGRMMKRMIKSYQEKNKNIKKADNSLLAKLENIAKTCIGYSHGDGGYEKKGNRVVLAEELLSNLKKLCTKEQLDDHLKKSENVQSENIESVDEQINEIKNGKK